MFEPQIYNIPDEPHRPFIDREEILSIIWETENPPESRIREVLEKSLSFKRLSLHDTAVLLNSRGEENNRLIREAASRLKEMIYGDRIVIFAPLYLGNLCVNNCTYCGFRTSNKLAVRKSLTTPELRSEVGNLLNVGHKRLILVFGEHPSYSPGYIAGKVREVYSQGEQSKINRVNINAAPFDTEGFRVIKDSGIGTYQIFQETYDPLLYGQYHPTGPKSRYDYRLTAMDRAMEAGIDDVGLGVLLGLGDWKFEVLALMRHVNHLEACYGVGPHTISFPRIRRASGTKETGRGISDEGFRQMVAVLRLAVPYTGLILTARETEKLRDELIPYGITQIDAGSRIEIGGYSSDEKQQDLNREQFELSDTRSLSSISSSLTDAGLIPSFCTACYRKGRTGEHFMEVSCKGFIKDFCTPNALLSFAEYLEDYAPETEASKGWELISHKLRSGHSGCNTKHIQQLLEKIKQGQRDIYL